MHSLIGSSVLRLEDEALLRGDGLLLETLIEEALERRNQTKYAVIEHQRQHGC